MTREEMEKSPSWLYDLKVGDSVLTSRTDREMVVGNVVSAVTPFQVRVGFSWYSKHTGLNESKNCKLLQSRP